MQDIFDLCQECVKFLFPSIIPLTVLIADGIEHKMDMQMRFILVDTVYHFVFLRNIRGNFLCDFIGHTRV